ncbi:hypothetical protein BJ912DRAFT_136613 [Pholiota molesta]|nr:hypothetical protein BJ912DRAFT_136613 [Pholiota molesta]
MSEKPAMPSPRPAKKPSWLPSGRFATYCSYLLDCSYLLTRAKQLVRRGHHGWLCTNWRCAHANPAQALAGTYACHGCGTGTYVVRPSEVRGTSVYVYLPPSAPASDAGGAHSAVSAHFAAQRRQKTLDRQELARDLSEARTVVGADYDKPLPGIPGLALRKLNRWDTIPGTQLRVTVHPPTKRGDSYYPSPAPPAASHRGASALGNFRGGQPPPVYCVDAAAPQARGYPARQSVPFSVLSQASSFSKYTAVTSVYSQYEPEVHLDDGRSYSYF